MTGLEMLKEELRMRGCTKAQVESKVVAEVLTILSGVDFTGEWTASADIEQQRNELRALMEEKRDVLDGLRRTQSCFENEMRDLKDTRERIIEELEKLQAEIMKCETPEGRDRTRAAQAFKNSVNVNSKYDNTAYIIGLAAIMTGGEVGALDTIGKINPKMAIENIPKTRLSADGTCAVSRCTDAVYKQRSIL